jgi:hypothetical protein
MLAADESFGIFTWRPAGITPVRHAEQRAPNGQVADPFAIEWSICGKYTLFDAKTYLIPILTRRPCLKRDNHDIISDVATSSYAKTTRQEQNAKIYSRHRPKSEAVPLEGFSPQVMV